MDLGGREVYEPLPTTVGRRVCRSECGCVAEYRDFDDAGLRHNFGPLGRP